MKALFFITCAFLTVNLLHSVNVTIRDEASQYYFSSSLGFEIGLKREGPGSEWDNELVSAARNVTLVSQEVQGESVFYRYAIDPSNSTTVTALELTIEAQKTKDNATRYVREFQLGVAFKNSTRMGNWTGTDFTFVVRPPRFPHFRVKPDWQYSCPKHLVVALCHVSNGSAGCSTEVPYSLLNINMTFDSTLFYGGKDPSHDYSGRVEDCPLAYQTRPDIGIACIVAFWTIVLAAVLWGVIKFLIKRNRKNRDD